MALPTQFRFEVVKPDSQVLSEMVEEAVIPGALGSFGVLPGHAPFLTLVGAGAIMYRTGSVRRWLAVAGGVCEVLPERVTVLAESAERAEDIDPAHTERERARARAELERRQTSGSGEEIAEARAALEHAELRLSLSAKARPSEAGRVA